MSASVSVAYYPKLHYMTPGFPVHNSAHLAPGSWGYRSDVSRERSDSSISCESSDSGLLSETSYDSSPATPGEHVSHHWAFDIMMKDSNLLSRSICVLLHQWLDAAPQNQPHTIFVGSAITTIEVFMDSLAQLNYSLTRDSSNIVIAVAFVRRVMNRMDVSWKNVFRLFLISLMMALKYNEDEILFNSDFANQIGLDRQDVCRMEQSFLSLLQFELFVSEEEFNSIVGELLPQAELLLNPDGVMSL